LYHGDLNGHPPDHRLVKPSCQQPTSQRNLFLSGNKIPLGYCSSDRAGSSTQRAHQQRRYPPGRAAGEEGQGDRRHQEALQGGLAGCD